jgi:myo-inositol 2-dehydrogenase / D-chiro-inositol 1-dehydrogenase
VSHDNSPATLANWNRTRLDYPTMSIRLGLIGCGDHSEIGHAMPLARYGAAHPETIDLAAACDLRPERAEMFCHKYGFARPYHQADDVLTRERLNACIAVVPVEHISEVGIKLLQANMPCVVEKPLGATIAEARRLLEAAKATGTTNMVSMNRRFMPLLNRGMEWAKAAGDLHYVHCAMLRHARTEPDFLRFTTIHALDTMRFICGEVSASEIRSLTPTAPHWFAIDLRFENGVQGRIDVLPTAGLVEETYELIGGGFRAVITSPFGLQRSLRCYQENRLVLQDIAGNETPEDVTQGFYGEATELIRALSHGKRPKPSIEEVFPSVELCFELADRAQRNAHRVPTAR